MQGGITDAATMAAYARTYRNHFVDPLLRVSRLSDSDVEAGFLAAYNAAFYSQYYDPDSYEEFLKHVARYADELQLRRKMSDRHAVLAHQLFLTARDFARAESIRANHPGAGISPAPDFVVDASFDPKKPGVFVLASGADQFRLTNVAYPRRDGIVVVAGCEISRGAAREIFADPRLRKAFLQAGAVWLGSADTLDVELVRRWNESLPEAPLHVVYDQRAWAGIDFASHPSFHFFRDGSMVAAHEGWSPHGVPLPVETGLRTLGVVTEGEASR
jgi:hypothetical protein